MLNSYAKANTSGTVIYRPRKSTNHPEERLVVLLHKDRPLRHQFLPIFLSLRTSHRPFVLVRDHREEFEGEFCKSRVLTCATHGFSNPPVLLRCHVRGRRDLLRRINQEEDEDPAVTGFGGILQAEWLDLVLIQVRECNASVRFGYNIADILQTRGFPCAHIPQFIWFGKCRDWTTHLSIS